jgi:hypothetical protein
MRPRGEVRLALAQAVEAAPAPGATWRELAAQACVGLDSARRTVGNMVAAGELIVVGHKRVPHARRPMNVLARPGHAAGQGQAEGQAGSDGCAALARCWAGFR